MFHSVAPITVELEGKKGLAMKDLHDKVVVITGASSGIGRATTLEFAAEGANVVLAGRDAGALKEAEAEAQQAGAKTLISIADVTDENAVEKLADQAEETFGHIDIWVNNAGVGLFAKFEDTPAGDYKRIMDTNFFGYVNGARSALKRFKAQGFGTLINVDSVESISPRPYNSAYSAAKHAVRALTSSLRMELALDGAKNITVSSVLPASVDTPFYAHAANYTGQTLHGSETATDPAEVARAITRLAKKPQREVILRGARRSIMQFMMNPAKYEIKHSGRYLQHHLTSDNAVRTQGSLYDAKEPHAVSGGWRKAPDSAQKLKQAMPWIALAGTVAAVGGIATWLLWPKTQPDAKKLAESSKPTAKLKALIPLPQKA